MSDTQIAHQYFLPYAIAVTATATIFIYQSFNKTVVDKVMLVITGILLCIVAIHTALRRKSKDLPGFCLGYETIAIAYVFITTLLQ